METPVGRNLQNMCKRNKQVVWLMKRTKLPIVNEGEQIFLNMTRTLQEFSNHGKKLSMVTETVHKLKTEVQKLKRNRINDEDQTLGLGTSKKQKRNTVNLDSEYIRESDRHEGLIQKDISSGNSIDEIPDDSSSEDSEEEDNLQDLHNYFVEKSETGDNVSERMDDIVNKSLTAVPNEKALQELLDKHERPANLDTLQGQTIDSVIIQKN